LLANGLHRRLQVFVCLDFHGGQIHLVQD
jgi:hypothetical protein